MGKRGAIADEIGVSQLLGVRAYDHSYEIIPYIFYSLDCMVFETEKSPSQQTDVYYIYRVAQKKPD